MNGLEDALHDYLAQFDEPIPANSVRYVARLEQQLMQAGCLPAKGKASMTTPPIPSPLDKPTLQRVRIHEHVTQSRFLHIEDALGIGKLRLFAGAYERNKGARSLTFHFLSVADARVIFSALANAEPNFNYKEYKGTPPQNGKTAVSRVLSVTTKGENVYIELKTSPGKLTNTGAIAPNGQPTAEVNVAFKIYEARRMALTVLAYLHAWDVMQMMSHRHMVSKPMPYLLVPTFGEGGVTTLKAKQTPAAQTTQPTAPLSSKLAQPHRPMTRKGALLPNGNGRSAPNGNSQNRNGEPVIKETAILPLSTNGTMPQPVKPNATTEPLAKPNGAASSPLQTPLKYQNGKLVELNNKIEVTTFRQFVVEKKEAPLSREMLQAYYRERITAVVP